MENHFLAHTNFLNSDEISVADLMAVTELSQLEVCIYVSPFVAHTSLISEMYVSDLFATI